MKQPRHSCRADILCHLTLRSLSFLSRLIEALIEASRSMGCYKVTLISNPCLILTETCPPVKVILDCAESNVAFYEKCGLTRKEVQMVSEGDTECRDMLHL